MADYSLFPWDTLTRDEIAKLMIHSKEIGDGDFVKACVEQLKRRPTKDALDLPSVMVNHCNPANGVHASWCTGHETANQ